MSEITAPYVLNTNQSGQEVIDDVLGYLIGEMVSVCYTTTRNEKRFEDLSDPSRSFTVETGDRDNFHTQISVNKGRLLNTSNYFYSLNHGPRSSDRGLSFILMYAILCAQLPQQLEK